jgi:PhnB protein
MKTHPNGSTYVNAYITVEDLSKALEFYKKAFGFKIYEEAKDEKGVLVHAETQHHDQLIMFGKAGAWGGTTQSPKQSGVESPITLYLYVENVDQFYKHALTNGAVSISEPQDAFWGDRMCSLKDLDGYTWCIATHINT